MEQLQRIGTIRIKASDEISSSPIGIGFEKLDRGVFSPEKAYDKIAAIGVKWARLQSGWARTETVRGVYDFSWLDDIVDNLLRRGIQPWLCLCYGNSLYTPHAATYFGSVGCPPIGSAEERAGWADYVSATVRHYRGRISLYEVWNEPDLKFSWRHGTDPEPGPCGREYGAFCLETARVVHQTDPQARVAGFALAHPYELEFLADALTVPGLADALDAVSFHVYTADDSRRPVYIRQLRTLLSGTGKRIDLIQGEAGAQSRSDGNGAMRGYAWTPERQRTYLLRGILHDLAAGLPLTSYFSTLDMIEALNGVVTDRKSYLDYGYFGVLSADFDENGMSTGSYSPKPSYTALGNLLSVFSGDFTPAELPLERLILPSKRLGGTDCAGDSLTAYGFRKGDAWGLTFWNPTPLLTTTYEGTVSFRLPCDNPGHLRLADLADGAVYAIPDDLTEQNTDGTVTLKNLPLSHSPYLLCEMHFLE